MTTLSWGLAVRERSEHERNITVEISGPEPSERSPGANTVHVMAPRVVVIDNYDSFVYILVQYLGELGADLHIHRHDEITVDEIAALEPDAILVSPGPGTPDGAGISLQIIKQLGPTIPVLGVCLGHQCIGQVFGGDVVRAPTVMHGKTSTISHNGQGVFAGLDTTLTVTRYHSLVVEPSTVPDVLEVTATSEDGVIMGLRHRSFPIEGVQFHPESVLTDSGHAMLTNFLAMSKRWAETGSTAPPVG